MDNERIDMIFGGVIVLSIVVGSCVGFFGGGFFGLIVGALVGVLLCTSLYLFVKGIIESEIDKRKAMDLIGGGLVVLGLDIGLLVGFFVVGGVFGTLACTFIGVMLGVAYMLIANGIVGKGE